MKLTKANTRDALIRDVVGMVVADARPNTSYTARCTTRIRAGKIERVWRISPRQNGGTHGTR
jgi:hypothetical protein